MAKNAEKETDLETQARELIAQRKLGAARTLLLDAAYALPGNPRARALFSELFPDTPLVKKQLAGPIADLKSPEVSRRRAAAKAIGSAALKTVGAPQYEWLSDGRTTAALTEALADSDPTVAEWAVTAIGRISQAYFKDRRAYPGVLPLLKSDRAPTRMWAIRAAWALGGAGAWKEILSLFQDPAPAPRKVAMTTMSYFDIEKNLPDEARREMRPVLLSNLRHSDTETRAAAAGALGIVGDSSTIAALEKAAKEEKDEDVKESIDSTIEYLSAKA